MREQEKVLHRKTLKRCVWIEYVGSWLDLGFIVQTIEHCRHCETRNQVTAFSSNSLLHAQFLIEQTLKFDTSRWILKTYNSK